MRHPFLQFLTALLLVACREPERPAADLCEGWEEPDALHVAPGADGDGTAERPLGSIAAALERAAAGGARAIRLDVGTYAERVVLGAEHDGVSILGRCDGETVLAPAEAGDRVSVDARGADLSIGHVTVAANDERGIVVDDGTLHVDTVRVRDAGEWGVSVTGLRAGLVFEGLEVTGTRVTESLGGAVDVASSASVEGHDCVLDDNAGIGVVARTGSYARIEECHISGRGSSGDTTGIAGDRGTLELVDVEITNVGYRGVSLTGGATAALERVTIADVGGTGILADGASTFVSVQTSQIVAVRAVRGEAWGGIAAVDGAVVHASDVTVDGCEAAGIVASGGTIELADVLVRGTRASAAGTGGAGLTAEYAGTLTGRRVLAEDNENYAAIADEGGTLELEDSVLRDTVPGVSGDAGVGSRDGGTARLVDTDVEGPGHGAYVYDGRLEISGGRVSASLTGVAIRVQTAGMAIVSGATITDAAVGLNLSGLDAAAWVEGATITGIRTASEGAARAVGVQAGATLTFSGGLLDDNDDLGVYVSGDGTSASFDATTVRSTGGGIGYGAIVREGASASFADCTFDANRTVGLAALGAGTIVTFDGGAIRGTARSPLQAVAPGAGADEGASVLLRGTVVSDNEGPGLVVLPGAAVTCEACALSGNGFAGAAVLGGTLDLKGSTVDGNVADANEGGGVGVYAAANDQAPVLRVEGTAIGAHTYAAAWLDGAGTYTFLGNMLVGGTGVEVRPDAWMHGDAIVALGVATQGGGQLRVETNTLRDALQTGILLHGSGADLVGNTYTGNGVDLLVQGCDAGVPAPSPTAESPTSSVCPPYDAPIAPLSFDLALEDVSLDVE